MKYRNIIRIIDDEEIHDITIFFNNKKYYISLKDFTYYLNKSSEHFEKINNRIEKALDYLERVKTLAEIDKVNILSIGTLENILKGNEDNE